MASHAAATCPVCHEGVLVHFTPGYPGRWYARNGDPGNPPEPPELFDMDGHEHEAQCLDDDDLYNKVLDSIEPPEEPEYEYEPPDDDALDYKDRRDREDW